MSITTTSRRLRLDVPMRDGVLLATDVYLPAEAARPLPVLLERTPYDVRATRFSDGVHHDGSPVTPESGAEVFVDAGFVVVRQDCRGRGASQGTFTKYVNEAADGADAHAWILAQPWCDGRIVTHGVSYGAHTQAAAASVGAPGIAAMVLDSGGFSSAFEAGGRFGGAFELKQAVWSIRRAHDRDGGVSEAAELSAWFAMLPWRAGSSPLAHHPDYEAYLFEQWEHEDLDEFWRQPGLYARGYYGNFPLAPVLNISSWYDPYVLSAVENFHALHARHPGSGLVLGPWTHGARSRTWAGDVDFGPRATLDGNLAPDYLDFRRTWIAEALDPGSRPAAPTVRYFLMGGGSGRRRADGRLDHGGSWFTSSSWPPEGARTVELHLRADQTLASTPDPVDARIAYDFDPHDPVPSRGGGITSGEPLMQGGAFDQVQVVATPDGEVEVPLNARPDVVTFQTAPLREPVAVAGRVRVRLRFSSDAPDTDVAVKLVDVHPPTREDPRGFAMNVTDGMLRVRHREDPAHPRLMEPGEVYALDVVVPDTANLFGVGHRIRLDVTSSNFPRCDVNPGTGGPVAGARTSRTARNVVHVQGSALLVDVVAATDLTPLS